MFNDTVTEAIRTCAAPSLDLASLGLGTVSLENVAAKRAVIAKLLPVLKYLPAPERESWANRLADMAGVPGRSNLMMREDQVRELHAAGMEVGAHTVTHPILLNTAPEAARREIVESGRRLAEILRQPIDLFAYPNGKPGVDYGAEHVAMVCDAGYATAVSTGWGVATAQSDRFQLPRFTPWDRTPRRFALRLIRNMRNPNSAGEALSS
jgi:hypothetical protein